MIRLALLSILLSTALIGSSYAFAEEIMYGQYNPAEYTFENGTKIYKHFLIVTDEEGNLKKYEMNYETLPENMSDMIGDMISVKGDFIDNTSQMRYKFDKSSVLNVEDITIVSKRSLTVQPSTHAAANLLIKFSDISTEIAGAEAYYDSRWCDAGLTDSMAAYWTSASYGKLTWTCETYPYKTMTDDPATSGFDESLSTYINSNPQYPTDFSEFIAMQRVIAAHESAVDFNNFDSINMIHNDNWGFAYAFVAPITFSVEGGTNNKSFLIGYTYHLDEVNFPNGLNFENGIGVHAHEMGHTFGWFHTMQTSPFGVNPPYDDGWSLLSGGDADGPPGLIAYHRNDAGWIAAGDKINVPIGTPATFSLDFLSSASPDPNNYLMGTIPFGGSGHYYTVEARKDVTNDQTPQDQTGLMIYHYSPTGHPNTPQPEGLPFPAPILLVTADGRLSTPTNDFDNADLDVGVAFLENGVNFIVDSVTSTSIAIRIGNQVALPAPLCAPDSGTWTVTASCTMTGDATAPGNVLVKDNAVLTIPSGITLNINFASFNLTVESGSGVLIESGGTIT